MWRTAAAARVQLRAHLGLTSTSIEEGAARAALSREAAAAAQMKARVRRAAVCDLFHHYMHCRMWCKRQSSCIPHTVQVTDTSDAAPSAAPITNASSLPWHVPEEANHCECVRSFHPVMNHTCFMTEAKVSKRRTWLRGGVRLRRRRRLLWQQRRGRRQRRPHPRPAATAERRCGRTLPQPAATCRLCPPSLLPAPD